MGGTSKTSQVDTQRSSTNPWSPSQGLLTDILDSTRAQLGNAGVTGAENTALNQLAAGAQNPYAGLIGNYASDLLSGGGANNQAGAINQNFAEYQRRLNPIADGQNIGPNGNPALKGYLDTIANDVQTRVNGMFAGAGRDMSGMNQGQLARGITEGTAPILAAQYNTDVGNMRSAADSLYGAGNTNAGLLAGLQQQSLANRGAGVEAAQAAHDAQLSGARGVMATEAARRGIPVQSLGLLAQIGIPIAGLGQQSEGIATRQGTQQMSGAQQFATIGQGFNSFLSPFSGGGSGGGSNAMKFLFG